MNSQDSVTATNHVLIYCTQVEVGTLDAKLSQVEGTLKDGLRTKMSITEVV
jgi:hypothetical protein